MKEEKLRRCRCSDGGAVMPATSLTCLSKCAKESKLVRNKNQKPPQCGLYRNKRTKLVTVLEKTTEVEVDAPRRRGSTEASSASALNRVKEQTEQTLERHK